MGKYIGAVAMPGTGGYFHSRRLENAVADGSRVEARQYFSPAGEFHRRGAADSGGSSRQ